MPGGFLRWLEPRVRRHGVALDASEGDFVCLHDDDDSWHPDFLAHRVRFLRAPEHAGHVAAVCHCTTVHERVDGDGIVEAHRRHGLHSPARVDDAQMLRANQVPPISLLMRRRTVDAVAASTSIWRRSATGTTSGTSSGSAISAWCRCG